MSSPHFFRFGRPGNDNGSATKSVAADAMRPSVFIATLPKSGTDFTVNGLLTTSDLRLPEVYLDADVMGALRTGYTPNDPRLISTGNFNSQTLNTEALKLYLDNGHIIPTHMAASHHNLMSLIEAGHSKISIIIRDPCDATVSLCYHIAKAGPELRNLHTEFQYVPADYHDWTHAEQIQFQAQVFLPPAINWIESWLGAQCDAYRELEMQFLHFDDLKIDSTAFLQKIADFHGITDLQCDRLPPPQALAHFRSGKHDQWRSEFSSETQQISDWLVGNRLKNAYEKAVLWRLSRAAASRTAGGRHVYLNELLSILESFPWVRDGFTALSIEMSNAGEPLDGETIATFEEYYRAEPPVMRKPWELLGKLRNSVGAVPGE